MCTWCLICVRPGWTRCAGSVVLVLAGAWGSYPTWWSWGREGLASWQAEPSPHAEGLCTTLSKQSHSGTVWGSKSFHIRRNDVAAVLTLVDKGLTDTVKCTNDLTGSLLSSVRAKTHKLELRSEEFYTKNVEFSLFFYYKYQSCNGNMLLC